MDANFGLAKKGERKTCFIIDQNVAVVVRRVFSFRTGRRRMESAGRIVTVQI